MPRTSSQTGTVCGSESRVGGQLHGVYSQSVARGRRLRAAAMLADRMHATRPDAADGRAGRRRARAAARARGYWKARASDAGSLAICRERGAARADAVSIATIHSISIRARGACTQLRSEAPRQVAGRDTCAGASRTAGAASPRELFSSTVVSTSGGCVLYTPGM